MVNSHYIPQFILKNFYNCVMMAEAKHHIAFSDIHDISYSLDRVVEYTDRDYRFLSEV